MQIKEQPAFDADITFPDELNQFIEEWKDKKGNLIPILHKVQETFGYIPKAAALKLSFMIDETVAKIYGVVSFYHLFKTTKPGLHKIQICTGTACYLKGANDLIDEFESLLQIKVGETTEDGQFTLETVRCIGCCGLAPVIMIDDDTYGNLTDMEQLPVILSKYVKKDKANTEN